VSYGASSLSSLAAGVIVYEEEEAKEEKAETLGICKENQ